MDAAVRNLELVQDDQQITTHLLVKFILSYSPISFLVQKYYFEKSLALTLLHLQWPKLCGVLAVLSAIGLR